MPTKTPDTTRTVEELFADLSAPAPFLWNVLAKLPAPERKQFRAQVSIPYPTGVAMAKLAPTLSPAVVRPNLAALLENTVSPAAGTTDEVLETLWPFFATEDAVRLISVAAARALAFRVYKVGPNLPPLPLDRAAFTALATTLIGSFGWNHTFERWWASDVPVKYRRPVADLLLYVAAPGVVNLSSVEALFPYSSPNIHPQLSDGVLVQCASTVAVNELDIVTTLLNRAQQVPTSTLCLEKADELASNAVVQNFMLAATAALPDEVLASLAAAVSAELASRAVSASLG